jgi:hypothetical protein
MCYRPQKNFGAKKLGEAQGGEGEEFSGEGVGTAYGAEGTALTWDGGPDVGAGESVGKNFSTGGEGTRRRRLSAFAGLDGGKEFV